MRKSVTLILVITIAILFNACAGKSEYEKSIEKIREEKNEYMKNADTSPFNAKTKVEFHPLNYYEPDSSFVFESKLYKYETPDSVTIYGTKGEPRQSIRYGYLEITRGDKNIKVNVYKNILKSGGEYYSIWFTDKTTNETTYGVGRYIDFELNNDPDYVYTIDFNLAYNPYCAYSSEYSCAIPTKEDYLDFAVEAGEKKFHD